MLFAFAAAAATGARIADVEIGSIVQRGPSWQWGAQDGGPGGLGVVVGFQRWRGEADRSKFAARVLWRKSGRVRRAALADVGS